MNKVILQFYNLKKIIKYNNLVIPVCILFIGIVLTLFSYNYVQIDDEKHSQREFEISTNDIKIKIQNRINSYIQFLQSSSSFYMASDTITRVEWKQFVTKSKISENLKGFQAAAHILNVPKKQFENHVQRFKKELAGNYLVHPNVIEEIFTPIVFIEPFHEKNLKAIGYNISSNHNMRKALEDSRDSNDVVLTDKVTLIQEGKSQTQSGIVMYSPVYLNGMKTTTIEERRSAITSWTAISIRMDDFMQGILGIPDNFGHNRIQICIYDNRDISKGSLLYNSKKTTVYFEGKLKLRTMLLNLKFNKKIWSLQFFQADSPPLISKAFVVLFGGGGISLLLSFLVFLLLNTKSLAKKIANELTMDLKLAKEKAEKNGQQLKLITNSFTNGMIYQVTTLDENRRKFNYVSNAVKELYGCTPKEVIENSDLIYGKIHPDDIDNLITEEKKALKNMSVFNIEARVINPDKSIRWSQYISKPRMINDLVCWDGFEIDISERKEMELNLKLSKVKAEESDRLKTEFLNNMSHEIRTPMNGILGFSGMLSDPELSVEKRTNFIRIIQSSTNQLLQVIDDILEISRLGTKQVKIINEQVCLNDLLIELFSIFDIKGKEQGTPIYLKKGLPDKKSNILIDKTKLAKILNNLLENSLKFTHEGYIEVGYQLNNKKIEIYIKDTGIGIEQCKYDLIFERFSQAEKDLSKKTGGLGLGLSIAKENAELIGGNIRLESKLDEGSTFFVSIPYKPVYLDNNKKIDSVNSQPKYTILIAEDEEVNYLYLETLLVDIFDLDCRIVHANNGVDAVKACKENKAIDLVLMDLKMPVLNGYDASAQIKKFNHNLPIIAQTAYSTGKEREQAFVVGCDDFLTKPIQKEFLKKVIDKYLVKK